MLCAAQSHWILLMNCQSLKEPEITPSEILIRNTSYFPDVHIAYNTLHWAARCFFSIPPCARSPSPLRWCSHGTKGSIYLLLMDIHLITFKEGPRYNWQMGDTMGRGKEILASSMLWRRWSQWNLHLVKLSIYQTNLVTRTRL